MRNGQKTEKSQMCSIFMLLWLCPFTNFTSCLQWFTTFLRTSFFFLFLSYLQVGVHLHTNAVNNRQADRQTCLLKQFSLWCWAIIFSLYRIPETFFPAMLPTLWQKNEISMPGTRGHLFYFCTVAARPSIQRENTSANLSFYMMSFISNEKN